jgi:hypothetical protein
MHKDPKFKKVLKEMLECYMQQGLRMDPLPKLRFVSDDSQANDIYGSTGYYDPRTMQIVIYIQGRHPKDVLRSLSHELIHHDQNLRGLFNTEKAIAEDPTYTQTNPYLRKMEMDANLRGNMMFRDFTDKQKYSKV